MSYVYTRICSGVYVQVFECAVVVTAGALNETEHPLKGCCLEWLSQYAHPDEVLIHSAVMPGAEDEHRTLVTGKIATHKLSQLLPMGRRLPTPLPSPCQPLSIDRIWTEEGEFSFPILRMLHELEGLRFFLVCIHRVHVPLVRVLPSLMMCILQEESQRGV